MQNRYPLWKYLLLLAITVLGFIYALPNFYGEDPAIQISPVSTEQNLPKNIRDTLVNGLEKAGLRFKSIEVEPRDVLIRFFDSDTQLKARDLVKTTLGDEYTTASNLMPATPAWLEWIGATPMKLGLDLRGGVHFLLQVDVDSVLDRRKAGVVKSIGQVLREKNLRYVGLSWHHNQLLNIRFRNVETREQAYREIGKLEPNLLLTKSKKNGMYLIQGQFSPSMLTKIRQYTVEQTMTTLRNRVNELGVGEAVVQQQGASRVAVDLPGIQDAARAKQILGGTATLEFRLVDMKNDPLAAASGVVPMGSLLYRYEGQPILLQSQVILSGDAITSASSTVDQQSGLPAVLIHLGGGGESLFTRVTRANVGKSMSIVYVETKIDHKLVDGKPTYRSRKVERVISVATIQSALGSHFQITGLKNLEEARNLSLLLRAGALPAAIYPVEERIVGPTLGMENIKRGMISLEVGMGLILLIMLVYYRVFGFIANIALFLNLVLLLGVLSMIDATLTLQGIAGIVLTVGMAVDANVLIYERIREELRSGMGVQAAIYAGYERAFSTIVDANVTTLIVAIVLFAVGSGPVKGFAVVLSIGLVTSMITGIAFTRALVNLIYGGRKLEKISIGI